MKHMFLTQWSGPTKVDLTLKLVCPTGPSPSLKYNLPNSLHCELTWHMLDRDALGHQHCLSGFFPACQMHTEGKGQLQSPGKKKKKQRIHVIMDAHTTLSQASQWKKPWQLNYWSILTWGGKSRHFLWQRELCCLKIVSSVAKRSLLKFVMVSTSL